MRVPRLFHGIRGPQVTFPVAAMGLFVAGAILKHDWLVLVVAPLVALVWIGLIARANRASA
jgi:hypothetical protein